MRKIIRDWRCGRKDSSEIGDVEERILLESWQVNLDYVGAGGISRYYLSLFRVPNSVCKSMAKCMKDFLWEGVDEGHRSHLVN